MRVRTLLALLTAMWLAATPTLAGERRHTVVRGQTLGAIARRYQVTIAALCEANGISRRDVIRPGQQLVIPNPARQRKRPAPVSSKRPPGVSADLQRLALPGDSPVYYYTPTGPGRKTLKPVVFYLHGRGGEPAHACHRWAAVARRVGWLVCPGGPHAYGSGRSWNNDWAAGRRIVLAALSRLRKKYGRRVQLYGNTLIGFSEGAHVAMNLGARYPRTFNRWLVLGASDAYWGAEAIRALRRARRHVRRVYLITGKQDPIVRRTRTVRDWLLHERIATRMAMPDGLGHEVALETHRGLYRRALSWLNPS
ncbi:MAG: LysM peptidoglycan-binding domain-containing protein [Polyangiaceae bacterium]|nr:LysM peptidoglycan-binding domain-containing protein [Polyangiaceae bacterium]